MTPSPYDVEAVRAAAQASPDLAASLGAVRGRLHDVNGCRVLPAYHPSAAIRFGPKGEPRRLLREDLALAMQQAAS